MEKYTIGSLKKEKQLQLSQTNMISVITPSVRPEGLKLVSKALGRQMYKAFEWIVVSPEDPNFIDAKWIKDPSKKEGDYWSLNRAMNEAIRHANGDLIVSWQDYTFASPYALEKFAFHFKLEPKTLVTGVGNKYTDDTWVAKTWQDPRERDDQGSYYPCFPNDIEGNFCSIPKAAIYAVGGFDEEMDKYAGLDLFNVLQRIDALTGYDFKIDQSNKSYSLEHGRLPNWDAQNWMSEKRYNEHIAKRKEEGKYPILDYLKSTPQEA